MGNTTLICDNKLWKLHSMLQQIPQLLPYITVNITFQSKVDTYK